jgi:hypothetical protein
MKKKSKTVYDTPLHSLISLLEESKKKENPAYWLHQHKARTPLFMLESIARVLYKSTNDSLAKSWHKLFKKLEDKFGEIDYYDAFIKQFKTNKAIKKEELEYLEEKLKKVVAKLNKKLEKEHFYIKTLEKLAKDNPGDFHDKGLLITIHEQIKTEVLSAEEFFSSFPNGFTDIESHVHALRRKLRWVSIYGLSLGGIIVLKDPKHRYKWEKEFITKQELSSPFNKLPVKKAFPYHIALNKKAFYALSHVISKLGELKDKGLAIEVLAKTIHKTGVMPGQGRPGELARKQLNTNETVDDLLKQSYDLLYNYFVVNKIHIELIS